MDILRKLGVEIGLRRRQTRIITATDIASFADLSGDYNPIHMDEEYAKKTLFGGRIAHGVISLGLLSAAMAQLPGLPIFMSQSVKFVKPVSIGDTITASVEVIDMRPDKGIVTLKNTCANQKGEVVIVGEAKCRLFERPI
jgi:3-hydroxybutyryl-CoA dehydratase